MLLTNPPFAGDIKDSRIIHQYDSAKGAKGNWETSVGRDILFIERNLEFLKPAGRAAIVLPQERFNNSSDEEYGAGLPTASAFWAWWVCTKTRLSRVREPKSAFC